MTKYLFLVLITFLLFSSNVYAECSTSLYQLSTGARVDYERIGEGGPNGAVAEKWCLEKGMRLPTKEELKEMYDSRDNICRYYDKNPKSCFNTEFEDAGGWPYWGERTGNHSDGKDFGWRIIFGEGSEDYVKFPNDKFVRKFGNQGEMQLVEFWVSSGRGAYARCVCDGFSSW
ncbi:MAG: hypothetical protein LBR70_00505 [Lactobacillaceae bacterium]|jgi:hypothetical protein|nr:hypothetical protein [Lactobacillaceae bacterium]